MDIKDIKEGEGISFYIEDNKVKYEIAPIKKDEEKDNTIKISKAAQKILDDLKAAGVNVTNYTLNEDYKGE